jgi:NADH dehydrogenase (ubiquinone) 1 beta subcomplex subunit 5
MSDHKEMNIVPSKFQWEKFKDLLHLYFMIGAIPSGLLILYTNIFIGPAQLSEAPEGYEPKHWEYHRHPITRWMARYIYPPPQQDYEIYLHHLWEEQQKKDIRQVEAMVKDKMAERSDYQSFYYRPMTAKYHRIARKAAEDLEALSGDR